MPKKLNKLIIIPILLILIALSISVIFFFSSADQCSAGYIYLSQGTQWRADNNLGIGNIKSNGREFAFLSLGVRNNNNLSKQVKISENQKIEFYDWIIEAGKIFDDGLCLKVSKK